MFYRWARRLESMQLPATAFPAAGGDPAVETEDSFPLDGALIAAAIAAVWILLQSLMPAGGLDRAVLIYVPILLVGLFGALLVRPQGSLASMRLHVAVYVGLAALLGVTGATSVLNYLVLTALLVVTGAVTAALLVLVWAVVLRYLVTPRNPFNNDASSLRVVCMVLIVFAAFVGALQTVNVPLYVR